jgi:hypothetical protein
LSGRTKDQNIGYIAEYLTAVGIDLKEVRVVGDEESAVVDAIHALNSPRSGARNSFSEMQPFCEIIKVAHSVFRVRSAVSVSERIDLE